MTSTQKEKRKVVSWVLFTDNALEEMLTKAKAGHGTYELEVSSTFDPELDRTYAVVTRSDVISNPIKEVGEDFDAKKAAEAYFASDSEEEEDLDTREELEEEEEDLDMESEFAEETERETSDDLETRAEREMEARDERDSNFESDMADKAAETYYTQNFT